MQIFSGVIYLDAAKESLMWGHKHLVYSTNTACIIFPGFVLGSLGLKSEFCKAYSLVIVMLLTAISTDVL